MYLLVCMSTTCMQMPSDARRGPLELDLPVVVSHRVGDMNLTQVFLTAQPPVQPLKIYFICHCIFRIKFKAGTCFVLSFIHPKYSIVGE